MTTLTSLKRPSKWRANVRNHLDQTVRSGHKLYGVSAQGEYTEVSARGKTVKKNRSVTGAVVAKRALKR